MTTSEFRVTGMTCGHCEAAVRDEVAALAGVDRIEVDRETGRLLVHATGSIDPDDVIAAVDEAGYSAEPVRSS